MTRTRDVLVSTTTESSNLDDKMRTKPSQVGVRRDTPEVESYGIENDQIPRDKLHTMTIPT